MRGAIIAFLGGAAWLQTRPSLPDAASLAVVVACCLASALLPRGAARACLIGGLLGYGWAAAIAHLALAHALPKKDEGRDLAIIGTIASLPHRFDGGVRFHFRVESVETSGATVPPRVALSWYGNQSADEGAIRPGERWRLVVRLQRPHGNANPHGFDYEAWLLEQGVRATGYVRNAGEANRRLDDWVPSPGDLIERTRATLRDRIARILSDKPYAGVIVALVIGDQRGIAQSDWDVFNRTGISHLVSISGLHITMVASLAAWLTSFLWRRSFFTDAQLPLRLPAQKASALAGAAVALLYVLLAGFGIPAQRTFYMLAVVAAALWLGRITSPSHVLCLALGVVTLLDPWAMLWPGFWLSFGAVAAILYAGAGRLGEEETGWRAASRIAARTQWAVTIGLVPLTLLMFGQVSLVSPLANAIAIPVISLFVTPLALVGGILPSPLADVVLVAAHAAVDLLARLMSWIAAPKLAVWAAPAPEPWMMALALFGTAWLLAPRGWPHRWAGLAAWTPLLTQLPTAPAPRQFTVTAFDVGQGMALLIETHGRRLLYDTGPQYAPGANGATRVILPYLRGRGIGRLDAMVVSHSDLDHAGGAQSILGAVQVDTVISSLPERHPAVLASSHHVRCQAGRHWTWDAVRFELLGPTSESYSDPGMKPNARSCVLKVEAQGQAILLAGDIEAAQEAALVRGGPERLRATVLLAPHHGSGTSSTASFLQAVHPELGIFQVGHRNRYRHPKREVYERYRQLGITRVRTDETGALALSFGQTLEWHGYRARHPRYWHGR
jgi:competence protein ComEC